MAWLSGAAIGKLAASLLLYTLYFRGPFIANTGEKEVPGRNGINFLFPPTICDFIKNMFKQVDMKGDEQKDVWQKGLWVASQTEDDGPHLSSCVLGVL